MLGGFGHSLPVGRIFGIPISAHWSLLALVVGLFVHDLAAGTALAASLALAVSLLVVLCILVHELAHAAAAHRFGYRTRGIELHAFGGVAQIGGGSASAWLSARNDILIALAGPLANFLLWAALVSVSTAVTSVYLKQVVLQTARFNLLLGAFNLVPCFPLDGGRALLSLLRLRMGPVRGDRLAYTVGLAIAAPGFIYGIVTSQPVMALLFFIAFDASRKHRERIDLSFGTGRVVHPFVHADDPAGATGWLDRLRNLFRQSRDRRPPKLRIIKGGRFEEPPDRRSGRLS